MGTIDATEILDVKKSITTLLSATTEDQAAKWCTLNDMDLSFDEFKKLIKEELDGDNAENVLASLVELFIA